MAHYETGKYECTISTHGIDKSKTKGTPYVFLNFTPANGEYERQIKLWMTEKTVERTISRLRDLGWTGDRFADLHRHSFADKVVVLECSHTTDGQFEDWDYPYDGPASAPQETDDATAKKLDALFGRELRKTATAEPADVGAATDEIDIPF